MSQPWKALKLERDLRSVRVLYRQPDTLTLWGIPYEMRTEIGQAPCHIEPRFRHNWIYLGEPGWYGNLTTAEVEVIKAFLAPLEARGNVPGGPHEWITLPQEGI